MHKPQCKQNVNACCEQNMNKYYCLQTVLACYLYRCIYISVLVHYAYAHHNDFVIELKFVIIKSIIMLYGAIQVVRNAIFLEIGPPPTPS